MSEVEGSPCQPSQLFRASVQQKKLPRLTELTASRLSPEFIQTLIILQTLNNRLHHSRRATQLRQFEPDFDFGSIFLSQLQRSRMLCESTFGQVDPGRRAKVYTGMAKVFPGRRVTLPSKASGPARRVAILVPTEPSLCFA